MSGKQSDTDGLGGGGYLSTNLGEGLEKVAGFICPGDEGQDSRQRWHRGTRCP